MTDHDPLKEVKDRIKELNDKATQMLLFLSFAIVGAATVIAAQLSASPVLVRSAIRWWVWAVFPTLFGVLPLKDFWWSWLPWSREGWFCVLRWAKIVALWVGVLLSGYGGIQFLKAILDP